MDADNTNPLLTALIGIASLVVVAAALLGMAELVTRLLPRVFRSRVWTALHLLALLAAAGAGFLVLADHRHTGEPLSPKDGFFILIWPALVYGGVVFIWLKSLVIAATLGLVSLLIRLVRGRGDAGHNGGAGPID